MIGSSTTCPGKQEWPELVGVKAEVAKHTIESENPHIRAIIVKRDVSVIQDYRCDRVWIRTSDDNHGIVVEVPKIGKQEWPELLGVKAEVAKHTIERENPHIRAIIVKRDASVIGDYRCDRVWIRTSDDNHGIVVEVPKIG